MPYPRRLLNDDEEIVVDIRPHWHYFWRQLLAVALTVAAAVGAFVLELDQLARWGALALLGVALLWAVARWTTWVTTNFVVTTERLIWRTGVFSKSGLEIPLERVNNILFRQSFAERLMRSGDLVIESAGTSGRQEFSDIPNPSRVQNEIYRAADAGEDRDLARIAGAGSRSVADELAKLDELRTRGVLSDEEFSAQKAQLLGEG
ncbi:hypothetical protein BH20ACT8_BH20ACT8_01420 [soil metagenome]